MWCPDVVMVGIVDGNTEDSTACFLREREAASACLLVSLEFSSWIFTVTSNQSADNGAVECFQGQAWDMPLLFIVEQSELNHMFPSNLIKEF